MGDLTKDFSRWEFGCKCGCGLDTIDFETLTALQELRDYYGRRVTVTSGARCKAHNDSLPNSSTNSQHLYFRAVDFIVDGVRPQEVQAYLSLKYQNRFGLGSYQSFTHLDTRGGPPARW